MHISTGLFSILLNHFNDIGMSEEDILKYLRISPEHLKNLTGEIDADTLGKYLELVVAKKNNHRIGLETGFLLPFSIAGSVFNLYKEYKTVREIFEQPTFLSPAANSICKYTDRIEGDYFYHEISIGNYFTDKYPVAARQWYEMQFGICLQLAHSYTGKQLHPLMIHSVYGKEGEADILEEYISCPVKYGQERQAMIFDKTLLDWPVITAKRELLPIMEDFINELQFGQDNRSLSGSVYKILLANFPEKDFDLQYIASKLNMSERNVQRKLKTEKTSYQEILNNIRIELSKKYLKRKIPFIEIASLLGFESQSAFNKFIRKQFGSTPGKLK